MPQDLMFGPTWSLPQLLIVLLLVVLLFGKGKVSDLMGDVAQGIKAFKTTPSPLRRRPRPQARSARKRRHLRDLKRRLSHSACFLSFFEGASFKCSISRGLSYF